MTSQEHKQSTDNLQIQVVRTAAALPASIDVDSLSRFLHHHLKPYEDPLPEIHRGVVQALEADGDGFVVLARIDDAPVGALVMLPTGMQGFIPENLLLFVAVDPSRRGRGIGRRVIEKALAAADGAVKLHVEYDNPAKRLYERIGFSSKYAEMRYGA